MQTEEPADPHLSMLIARGLAITSYAALEQSLCSTVTSLTNIDKEGGSLLFFSIVNARQRLRTFEKLFKRRFANQFNLFRNSVISQFSKLDETRNSIVHWTAVETYAQSEVTIGITRPDKISLVPPAFWWSTGEDPASLTIDEVLAFSDKCSVVSRALNIFYATILNESPGIPEEVRLPLVGLFSQPLPDPPPEGHQLYAPPARSWVVNVGG